MKRFYALVLAFAVFGFITGTVVVVQQLPFAESKDVDVSAGQKVALGFIENVLPIDTSRYNVSLVHSGKPFSFFKGSTAPNEDELLTYSLESENNTLNVICEIRNGVLTHAALDNKKGGILSDSQYSNITEAAVTFLQKYQEFSGLNSNLLVDLLRGINPAENVTLMSGNLKLEVKHADLTGTAFGDSVQFRWMQSFNGCDYRYVAMGFKDGFFSMIGDDRQVYSIGDTNVNISKEQAIVIALNAIQNYSYRMSDDWVVDEFDVLENRIAAVLISQNKGGNILYPSWTVTLPLNGTYPGSVTELLVIIWAGTGEVEMVHHQAYAQLYPKTPVFA
ncbi:MAG: hypothetical protein ACQCN5_07610 [Candidatus Bathyarchaeia archaeon]|jgi:hypothetical protein